MIRRSHRLLDFAFNPKMNRSLIFDLATEAFIGRREDAPFLGSGGTGKSDLAQAFGQAAIQQGYRVQYRETHVLLDELADAVADGTRKECMKLVATVPLLHRRLWHVQAAARRRRGSPGNRDAPLRTL